MSEQRVRCLFDYEAASEKELSFSKDDTLKVLQQHPSGWWKGEHISGRIGLFPCNFARPLEIIARVRALYNYQGNPAQAQLTFTKGEVIAVIAKDESGWWKGDLRGRVGLFPCNFVDPNEIPESNLAKTEEKPPVPVAAAAKARPGMADEPSGFKPDTAIAQHNFDAKKPSQLSFKKGDVIAVIDKDKCLARDTPVLLFDGRVALVQDVVVGDLLMGDDGSPRLVVEKAQGRQEMARIHTSETPDAYSPPFTCNLAHILSLHVGALEPGLVLVGSVKNSIAMSLRLAARDECGADECVFVQDDTIDIAVATLVDSSKVSPPVFDVLSSYCAGPLAFDGAVADADLPVHPYLLGHWLTQGCRPSIEIVPSTVSWFRDHAASLGGVIVEIDGRAVFDASDVLGASGLSATTRVPDVYMRASVAARLQLLAGLIDAVEPDSCDLAIELPVPLVEDAVFVARSAGLGVSKPVDGRFRLVGDASRVPCLVPRKQGAARRAKCAQPLREKVAITLLPEDDYFGFTITGNGRFVLGDSFKITHNTGWWKGELNGVIARFPSNFTKYVPGDGLAKPSAAARASRKATLRKAKEDQKSEDASPRPTSPPASKSPPPATAEARESAARPPEPDDSDEEDPAPPPKMYADKTRPEVAVASALGAAAAAAIRGGMNSQRQQNQAVSPRQQVASPRQQQQQQQVSSPRQADAQADAQKEAAQKAEAERAAAQKAEAERAAAQKAEAERAAAQQAEAERAAAAQAAAQAEAQRKAEAERAAAQAAAQAEAERQAKARAEAERQAEAKRAAAEAERAAAEQAAARAAAQAEAQRRADAERAAQAQIEAEKRAEAEAHALAEAEAQRQADIAEQRRTEAAKRAAASPQGTSSPQAQTPVLVGSADLKKKIAKAKNKAAKCQDPVRKQQILDAVAVLEQELAKGTIQ